MNEQQLTSQLQTPYARIVKPVLDWLFALVLLVVLSPVMLMTAVVLKLDSKGPSSLSKNGKVNIYGNLVLMNPTIS